MLVMKMSFDMSEFEKRNIHGLLPRNGFFVLRNNNACFLSVINCPAERYESLSADKLFVRILTSILAKKYILAKQ